MPSHSSSQLSGATKIDFNPGGTSSHPEPFPYDFKNVLGFPQRLFRPVVIPQNDNTLEAGSNNKLPQDTSFKVGKPRSFRKTPANKTNLKDVLENRYLPPLTRDEFINYLIHEERSSENWYFYAWLHGYTRQYTEWLSELEHARFAARANPNAISNQNACENAVTSDAYDAYIRDHAKRNALDDKLATHATPQPAPAQEESVNTSVPMIKKPSITTEQLPLHLLQSLNKALEAFFTSSSHFQLNLDQEVSMRIQLDARHCPDPSIFRKAEEAVEGMLNASLNQYLCEVSGNAGKHRSLFAIILGAVVDVLGLALFFLALSLRWPRLVRLACIPLFFLGTLTLVGGLRRTCIVIFLFGSARQLRVHEIDQRMEKAAKRPKLARDDSDNAQTLGTYYIRNTPQPQTSLGDDTATEIVYLPPLEPALSGGSLSLEKPITPSMEKCDDSTKSPVFEEQKEMLGAERQRRPTEASACTYVNPWEALEVEYERVASVKSVKTAPVFGPLTRIFSPEIIKMQRDAIVCGFQYGATLSVVLGAVVMAVPNFP